MSAPSRSKATIRGQAGARLVASTITAAAQAIAKTSVPSSAAIMANSLFRANAATGRYRVRSIVIL